MPAPAPSSKTWSAAHPDAVRPRNLLAGVLHSLGNQAADRGQFDEARGLYLRPWRSARPSPASIPTTGSSRASSRGSITSSASSTSISITRTRRCPTTRRASRSARGCWPPSRPRPSSRSTWWRSLENLGNLYNSLGRPAEALPILERCRDLRARFVTANPGNSEMRIALGGSLHNLAMSYERLGRVAEAERLYREAIGHQRRAREAQPEHMTYRVFLTNHLMSLGELLRRAGKLDEAAGSPKRPRALAPAAPAAAPRPSCWPRASNPPARAIRRRRRPAATDSAARPSRSSPGRSTADSATRPSTTRPTSSTRSEAATTSGPAARPGVAGRPVRREAARESASVTHWAVCDAGERHDYRRSVRTIPRPSPTEIIPSPRGSLKGLRPFHPVLWRIEIKLRRVPLPRNLPDSLPDSDPAMPGKRVANQPEVRGHLAIVQSHPDLAEVVIQTVRLWCKAHLDYDQTKYVVEQVAPPSPPRPAPHSPPQCRAPRPCRGRAVDQQRLSATQQIWPDDQNTLLYRRIRG